MQKILQILATLVIVAGSCVWGPPSVAVATSNCSDVQFIFARGSGEPLGGLSLTSWETALRAQLVESSLKYDFYELGSKSHQGAQYPATAVSGSAEGIVNLIGAFISSGDGFAFARSVAEGRHELKAHLKAVAQVCPQTKFVLGGYSQGAMLISGILDQLPAEKIIYVATFGDPEIYLPEGKGNRPAACRGRNLSNYRAYVTDCYAYEGVLGGYHPYQPAAYYDKLGTWCNNGDIMCSSKFNIADHSKYTKLGLYNNAANIIRSKLKLAYPQAFMSNPEVATGPSSAHDLVIFWHAGIGGRSNIDVATYKLAAQRLINQTYSLGGRVALYVYSESLHGQSMQLCGFDCSADEVNQKLGRITSLLTTGAHYNCPFSLMRTAFNELTWQVGATKSVVVLSEDKLDYADHVDVSLEEIAQLSLKIDPVNIYPILSKTALDSGEQLAAATNGKAYNIADVNLAVQEILQRPEAGLALESYVGAVGEEFTFDATKTNNGQTLAMAERYDWDLDADGVFELQNAAPVVQHSYAKPTEGYIQVRVTDTTGRSSTMSARLSVTEEVAPPPAITYLRAEKIDADYRVIFSTDATEVLAILNGAPMGVIPMQSSTGHFLVKDVNYHTTLQLIPYRSYGGRGTPAEISFGPTAEYDPDAGLNVEPETPSDPTKPKPSSSPESNLETTPSSAPAANENPSQSPNPSSLPSSSSLHSSTNLVAQALAVAKPQPAAIIPLVPNTGVAPSYVN